MCLEKHSFANHARVSIEVRGDCQTKTSSNSLTFAPPAFRFEIPALQAGLVNVRMQRMLPVMHVVHVVEQILEPPGPPPAPAAPALDSHTSPPNRLEPGT